jgi:hypothetical protein
MPRDNGLACASVAQTPEEATQPPGVVQADPATDEALGVIENEVMMLAPLRSGVARARAVPLAA